MVKPIRDTVDDVAVVVLFAIFSALLAACGVGLVAVGLGMLVDGTGAGVVGIICGLPACYGAYLFGRAAFRVRRDLRTHPLSGEQRRSRHREVRWVLGYAASAMVGAIVLPVPGAVRVLMAVSALLVVPLILAREFEPAKKHGRPSDP